MFDENESTHDTDPHMGTVQMITKWIESSDIMNNFCEMANLGCEVSASIVNSINLQLDSARFFMTPEHYNEDRIEYELDKLVEFIQSVEN
jgi:hypothetical protein